MMPGTTVNPHIIAAELGAGYRRAPLPIQDFTPGGDWVVVLETLTDATVSQRMGLLMLRSPSTIYGTIVACGADAAREHGLRPGDEIIYTAWQGGRWSFTDRTQDGNELRALLMRAEHVLCRIERTNAQSEDEPCHA